MIYKPKLPLPEPIRAQEPNTWANSTVAVRFPEITRRVLQENQFPAIVEAALQTLIDELPMAPIRLLTDTRDWNLYIEPYVKQNWLQVPWFFAETYFYRRILEATGYFQTGGTEAVDPFLYQKEKGLSATQPAIQTLCQNISTWLKQPDERDVWLAHLLVVDLWGNRADLSLWPADDTSRVGVGGERTQVLVDDSVAVADYLCQLASDMIQIDIIADNAGFELVCDLCLADFLLSSDLAAQVTFHLKSHPTFVSDAMPKDVRYTIDFLTRDSQTAAVGERLKGYVANGRLLLQTHPFWTSPFPMWHLPHDLRQQMANGRLIISKGDANYRRLLGDMHWPYITSFADIVSYMPAPTLALRTLKAELAAGLTAGQITDLNQQDSDWLINGQWGLIQFVT